MIRVFLADNEQLIRHGLRTLLELDGSCEVVGEAADGLEVVDRVPAAAVDVLLLDLRMPRCSGLDALARLGDSRPPTLVLTTFDDADLLLASVRAGARGFLTKDVALEELVAAIRVVARGDTWFQTAVTASLRTSIERDRRAPADPPHERITERERDVLRLMAGGYSNREIADILDTAEGTVKNQVSSILGKLGVRDRTRAVLKALENGII